MNKNGMQPLDNLDPIMEDASDLSYQ